MIERIRGFLQNVMELGLIGAIKYSISEKIRTIKEFIGYSDLKYSINNTENIDYEENIDYTEETEERESSPSDLLRFRFRMNPIA